MYKNNLRSELIEVGAAAIEPAGDLLGLDAAEYLGILQAQQKVGLFRSDIKRAICYVTQEVLDILQLPGRPGPIPHDVFDRAFHIDDRIEVDRLAEQAGRGSGGYRYVRRMQRADGEWRLCEVTARVRFNWSGEPTERFGVIRDVTDEVERSNEQGNSAELLQNVISSMPAPVAILDAELRYVANNKRWLEDFSVEGRTDLIGRSHYEVFPDTPYHWRELHHIALNGERVVREFETYDRDNGTRMTLNWVLEPWFDRRGEIGGIVIMAEVLRVALKQVDDESRRLVLEVLRDCDFDRPAATAA